MAVPGLETPWVINIAPTAPTEIAQPPACRHAGARCELCGWNRGNHFHTDDEVLIDRVPWGSIPYDARVTMHDDDWPSGRRHLVFTWDQQGRTAAVKLPVTPQTELVQDAEGHQWWYPYQAAPPPEPASLFAKRELTEEELCDPRLFDPLVYEPILGRMITPEPLPEWMSPLSAERMSGCLPVRWA